MTNVSENISQLEQEARELVVKFKELNEQTGSYREAKNSLQETKQRLESLIETTKNLTEGSKAVISKFNEISGAGFIERAEKIDQSLNEIKGEIFARLQSAKESNQLMLLIAYGGIAILVVLQIVQMFFMK